MAVVLEARGVHKTYEEDGVSVPALRGVDLAIEAGDFVGIMGPSGCGKSTLLHVLGALDRPTEGQVLLDGTPLSELSDKDLTAVRRRRFGFVFQAFNLVPVLSAEENIALPAVIDGRPAAARKARLDTLLEQVDITDARDQLPSRMSGGQQQRVAIARALMNEPAVLLADEPTGNLDHAAGMRVLELFRDLHAAGQTVVIVTHNPVIAAAAQRVVLLRDGQVVEELATGRDGSVELLMSRLVQLEA